MMPEVHTTVTEGYDKPFPRIGPEVPIDGVTATPTDRHGRKEDAAAAAATPKSTRGKSRFKYGYISATLKAAIEANAVPGQEFNAKMVWSWLSPKDQSTWTKGFGSKKKALAGVKHALTNFPRTGYPIEKRPGQDSTYTYSGKPGKKVVPPPPETPIDSLDSFVQVGHDMDGAPLFLKDGVVGTVEVKFCPLKA